MWCHRAFPRHVLPTLLTRASWVERGQLPNGERAERIAKPRMAGGSCGACREGRRGRPLDVHAPSRVRPRPLVGSACLGDRQAAGLGGARGGRRLSCSAVCRPSTHQRASLLSARQRGCRPHHPLRHLREPTDCWPWPWGHTPTPGTRGSWISQTRPRLYRGWSLASLPSGS